MLFQRCVIAFVLILSLSTILHNPVEAVAIEPKPIDSSFYQRFCTECQPRFGDDYKWCYSPIQGLGFRNETCDVFLIWCSIDNVREEPLGSVDKSYPQNECYGADGTLTTSTFFGDLSQYFSVEFLSSLAGSPYGIAVAGTTVAVGTAAVATPSSLGLIGGLGFPNPGFTLAGGGVLPTAILAVCKYYH